MTNKQLKNQRYALDKNAVRHQYVDGPTSKQVSSGPKPCPKCKVLISKNKETCLACSGKRKVPA